MAAVKLIKFVAVAILVSSSDAEPTNQTCVGQDQDEMAALQVGVQSHLGTCSCGSVCEGYKKHGHFSCSNAKKTYLASNPGVDPEAMSQTKCEYKSMSQYAKDNTKCWSHEGEKLKVTFRMPNDCSRKSCPVGFSKHVPPSKCLLCFILHTTSMNELCPHGWCECDSFSCMCAARGSCR
ncbi:unnamed protein product [Polarella glacialis]|uniref:Uncharacterized protein n=1 Tax=Polarella glacialis TaxID=89957 RepID=A0A813GT71_POLGL|nr:unnamed protein product [Polarella glacialis]CAE8691074.1 unnamed protein product [Polarella glacialis]